MNLVEGSGSIKASFSVDFLREHSLSDEGSVGSGVNVVGTIELTHVEHFTCINGTPIEVGVSTHGTDSDKFALVHFLSGGEHGDSD